MTNFPSSLDDDTTLPCVNDNITEIGAEAINALRDAVFSIETEIGIGSSGTSSSLATRLGVSINADGSIKPSALTSLGLVVLPITNTQISDTAAISESKLNLDYSTGDLYNYIADLARQIDDDTGWISVSGMKLEPHIVGYAFQHQLSDILIGDSTKFLKNKLVSNITSPTYSSYYRNYTNSYTTIKELNDEVLYHQFADGTGTSIADIVTNGGSTYPSIYGHIASGIYIDTSRFSTVPQTAQDLQQFAEFVDSSSLLLLGSRLQNLFSNGISRESRSCTLLQDGYGQAIVPTTTVTTYLLGATGTGTSPVDNIDNGDDIIEFKPSGSAITNRTFDSQFSLVKIGDIIRVNYGSVEVAFRVKEKKFINNGGSNKYIIRIDGKNLFYSTTASARIDRALINNDKYGVLAVSAANNAASVTPSLIISSPRGAQALGLGFNPDQFDASHYMLYLVLFTTGNPADGYTILPGIDVTGNRGTTPGTYTLESIVESTNNAFRQVGFNYRFNAFAYIGEFGICLSDSCGNSGFSIINAVVAGNGSLNQTETQLAFPNNVVDMFPVNPLMARDPLGFGPFGADIASPPYMNTYGSTEAAIIPTKLFVPLRKNNFYTNGIEKDRMSLDVGQIIDVYGDGYWAGKVQAINDVSGIRLQTTYRVYSDLSTSALKPGKTLVVQSYDGQGTLVDFGRYIVETITFGGGCGVGTAFGFTDITVYDAIHAVGSYSNESIGLDGYVALHFDYSSVSFNAESATDFTTHSPFKRYFEVYVDEDGKSFTHERARMNISGSTMTVNSVDLYTYTELAKFDILDVSPTLRGYEFGVVNKITLKINHYISDFYDGYLCYFDGVNCTKLGPLTYGKKGQVTRFYDETQNDYIDILFDVNTAITDFGSQYIDFQLFSSLVLDNEIMLLSTCQVNDTLNTVTQLTDRRQFGNISKKDFTTEALEFISMPEKLLHGNGVIRGFDLDAPETNPNTSQVYINGGICLVNGTLFEINNETIVLPLVQEYINPTLYNINWVICINDKGEYQPIVLLDYDPKLITPTNTSRVVKLYNYNSGSTYNVDGITFSNLINIRKDLTPLFIVASTYSSSSLSLQVTDVRKFVNDADTNLPLKLTTSTSQGNFRSPEAILNWVKYNNAFNAHAIVKGADSFSGIINSNIIFDFTNTVLIEGENNALLTFNNPVTIGSNITFKDLTLVFNNGINSVTSNVNNIMFDNCDITIRLLSDIDNIFNITTGDNIIFKDCSITITSQFSDAGGTVFKLNGVTNFQFLNSTLYLGSGYGVGQYPRDVFTLNNCTNFTLGNSNISGFFVCCINDGYSGTCSNSLSVYDSSIISSYPAVNVSGCAYDSTDQVNTGFGYIHMKIATTVMDVKIDNTTFSYNPDVANSDRYSFINIEFTNEMAILNNLRIENCKFNHLNVDSTFDDVRAAISIINITSKSVLSTTQQPTVINSKIANNYCNRNQSFVFTSAKNTDVTIGTIGNMIYPGLVAQDLVVENNICGAIGYWTSSSSKIFTLPVNTTSYTDKASNLVIRNNNCKYIGNLDSKGYYFYVSYPTDTSMYNVSDYPSGFVTIESNKCSWIHVGVAYYSNISGTYTYTNNASLQILNNVLYAYDSVWLNTIYNSILTNMSGFTTAAISVRSNAAATLPKDDTSVIISGNVTNVGTWLDSTLSTAMIASYYYTHFVRTYCSSQIINNIFRGISTTIHSLIRVGGYRNTITNNEIFRNNFNVPAYVEFLNSDMLNYTGGGVWSTLLATGTIKDNVFDSPTIDGTSENVVDLSFTGNRWIVESNKNQTMYVSIPITNSQLYNNISNSMVGMINDTDFCAVMVPGQGADSLIGFKSLVFRLYDNDSGYPQRYIGWQENLDKYLPIGVRIVSLKMGVRSFNHTLGDTTAIRLYLNRYLQVSSGVGYTDLDGITGTPPTPDSGGASHATGYDPDIINDTSAYEGVGFATLTKAQLNSTTYTQYLSITPLDPISAASDDFVVGMNYSFGVSLDIQFRRTASGTAHNIYFSPLLVKCRW